MVNCSSFPDLCPGFVDGRMKSGEYFITRVIPGEGRENACERTWLQFSDIEGG